MAKKEVEDKGQTGFQEIQDHFRAEEARANAAWEAKLKQLTAEWHAKHEAYSAWLAENKLEDTLTNLREFYKKHGEPPHVQWGVI
jgi:hypothetical protein